MQSQETAADPLAFSWEWDRAEFIRLHRDLSREVARRGPMRTLRIGFAVLAALGLGWGGWYAAHGEWSLFRNVVSWLLIASIWWIVFRWSLRRSAASSYQKLHRGALRLSLGSEGLESGCEICSSQMRWSAFQRWVETPEFFLFFYTPQCAAFLPKRVIENEARLDQVRSAASRYIGP